MSDINPREVLAGHLPDRIVDVVPITGGWSGTAIWRIDTISAQYAFRLFEEGWHAGRDRESAILQAAERAGLPVPRLFASGETEGHPWFLTGWSPGRTVLDYTTRRPWRIRNVGERFGEMQARIHQVMAPPELLSDSRDWMDWPQPVDADLRARLAAIPLQPDRLIHLDYHPLNVLIVRDDVSSILDWTNAHAGDPRADLARTFAIFRTMPGTVGLKFAILRPFAGAFLSAWWRGYRRVAGGQQHMPLFMAWAYRGLYADLKPKLEMPELDIDRSALQRTLTRIDHAACEWERRVMRNR